MHSLFSLKTNSRTGIVYRECGKVCKSAARHERIHGCNVMKELTVKALQSLLLEVFMSVEPVPRGASL